MAKSRLPKSARIFLRSEKARIRREVFNKEEAEAKIKEVVLQVADWYNKKGEPKLKTSAG